jgi:hypothetical protein
LELSKDVSAYSYSAVLGDWLVIDKNIQSI